MNDTSPEAAEVQASVLRRLTGVERLDLAFEMSLFARELALTRRRRRSATAGVSSVAGKAFTGRTWMRTSASPTSWRGNLRARASVLSGESWSCALAPPDMDE